MKLNQRHDQVTPLHRAVTKGHLAAVQRLVAAGAKLLKDREGADGRSWRRTSWDLIWVNYNELTTSSLEIIVREIIPKWP